MTPVIEVEHSPCGHRAVYLADEDLQPHKDCLQCYQPIHDLFLRAVYSA